MDFTMPDASSKFNIRVATVKALAKQRKYFDRRRK